MLRLLYQLLIQRINENRQLRQDRSSAASSLALVRKLPNLLWLKWNIVIAALLITLSMLYLRYGVGVDRPEFNADYETAKLEVSVNSVRNPPMVVFLEKVTATMNTLPTSSEVVKVQTS